MEIIPAHRRKCFRLLANRKASPIRSPNRALVPTLSSRLLTGELLKKGENAVSAGMTYEADALYMLAAPKVSPTMTDCKGPNRHPATRMGMYAVVTEIGGMWI